MRTSSKRERWAERLARIESDARTQGDKKLTETIADVRERHVKTLRVMHARAVAGLREFPITTCMDAMRAAELVMRMERAMCGETAERDGAVIERVTRQEIARLLTREPCRLVRPRLVDSEAQLPERRARVDLDDFARAVPSREWDHAVLA